MNKSTYYLPLIGRFLISVIFLVSGAIKLANIGAMKGYIAAVGLPLPEVSFWLAVAVELGAGTLLLVGYRARLVALVLAMYCVITALFFHANFADQMQFMNFLKNLAMAGGLMQVAAFGAGAVSVDARRTSAKVGLSNA
jgi:putative oxidoreductase